MKLPPQHAPVGGICRDELAFGFLADVLEQHQGQAELDELARIELLHRDGQALLIRRGEWEWVVTVEDGQLEGYLQGPDLDPDAPQEYLAKLPLWVNELRRWSRREAGTLLQALIAAAWRPDAATDRQQILVVDDEPIFLEGLHRLLRRRHDVTTTTSPQAGLMLARLQSYDRVFVDALMPEMDGIQWQETLARTHPHLRERTVLMTACERILALGHPRTLAKPFGYRDLAPFLA